MEDQITAPIREAIFRHFPNHPISYLITCPWCTSVWVAAALLALPYLSPTVSRLVTDTLALSESSTALTQLTEAYL